MRHYFILTKLGKIQKFANTKCWDRGKEIGTTTLGSNLILSMQIGNAHIPTFQEIYSQVYILDKLYLVAPEDVYVCGSITFNSEK